MAVDFLVSWVAASHSVWSPTIYWMLNPKFRRAGKRFFIKYVSLLFSDALRLMRMD